MQKQVLIPLNDQYLIHLTNDTIHFNIENRTVDYARWTEQRENGDGNNKRKWLKKEEKTNNLQGKECIQEWKEIVRNRLLLGAKKKLNIPLGVCNREKIVYKLKCGKMFLSWSRWSWLCKGEMM